MINRKMGIGNFDSKLEMQSQYCLVPFFSFDVFDNLHVCVI